MPKNQPRFPYTHPDSKLASSLCRVLHGVNDMLITGATTKISFQSVPDFIFGGAGISLKELMCRDDHARRAEAALQPVALPESVLYRMKLAILREAFNRRYLRAIRLNRQHRAGLDRLPIHNRRAGAAQTGLAPDVRACKSGNLSKVVNQKQPGLDFVRVIFTVDCRVNLHVRHCANLPFS